MGHLSDRGVSSQDRSSNWDRHLAEQGVRIRESGRWRSLRSFDAEGPGGILQGGKRALCFASNAYLGLDRHPHVIRRAVDALETFGTGTSSSRLIVGSCSLHTELESMLARWKSTESALVFPTGFAANLGVITSLGEAKVTIFSDELNHASIVDGARLSRSAVKIYPHRDLVALEAMMAEAVTERLLIVTDLVFSMDGDVADVLGLIGLAQDHDALVVVDEAHSVLPLEPEVEAAMVQAARHGNLVRVGTLSKALGSMGGFVACARRICDLIVNTARSFIFTTALSPPAVGAALGALEVLRSAEGDELVARLAERIADFAPGHPSQIVPVIVGDEQVALRAADDLLEAGYLVPAIRPPTVAPGTSRLRISLSAQHSREQVMGLSAALAEAGLR